MYQKKIGRRSIVIKKIVMWTRQFKELKNTEKLLVVILLILMVRVSWPLIQIIYTVMCNIIELHG